MSTLFRVEWLKIRKYNAFWWLLGLTALAYPGINYIFYLFYQEITMDTNKGGQLIKMAIGNPYAFPDVWHTVAYFSSWFLFIPAVIVIMFITNEYSFRTHRQNIIDGWSRKQFITAKLIDVAIVSCIIASLYVVVTLVAGFASHTRLIRDTWGSVHFAGRFLLQTFAQLSLAFLVGFLIRKAFIALGVFVIYFFPTEALITGYLDHKNSPAAPYFPLEISDRMIPPPPFFGKLEDPARYQERLDQMNTHVVLTIVEIILLWSLCYWIHGRRDLK